MVSTSLKSGKDFSKTYLKKTIKAINIRCPAKVNLYLNTLRKRPDGFHEIESIFHAVSLFDHLELVPRKDNRFCLNLSPASTFPVSKKYFLSNNILTRVHNFFHHVYNIPGVEVSLNKHIPIGAGLGGGSSNAAGLIYGLNRLFDLGLVPNKMEEIGAKFGSDVPFFIRGGMAWVGGRGEIIKKYPWALNHKILLCYPNRFIETARSYREFNTMHPEKSLQGLKDHLNKIGSSFGYGYKGIRERRMVLLDLIEKNLFNSFQEKTLKSFPDLAKIHQILKEKSNFCLMSGSGSSFFALFHDIINLKNTFSQLRSVYPATTYRLNLIGKGVMIE